MVEKNEKTKEMIRKRDLKRQNEMISALELRGNLEIEHKSM